MKAKKWILNKHFDGWPKDENFKLIEEDLPELQTNRIFLAFDYLKMGLTLQPFSLQWSIYSTNLTEDQFHHTLFQYPALGSMTEQGGKFPLGSQDSPGPG